MIKLPKFEEYVFDLLLENKKELPIILSDRLKELLATIQHPISTSLLEYDYLRKESKDATLIDYDDSDNTRFTYMIPSKIIDYCEKNKLSIESHLNFNTFIKYNKFFWKHTQRVPISIGKLIRKLFPGQFETPPKKHKDDVVRNYIEEFTNAVIGKRKELDNIFDNFKIVKGSDIVKYYNESNYDYTEGGGSLSDSCMRYNKCGEFVAFYAENDVEMVVLMSDKKEDKIIGRAILWDIAQINRVDSPGRKFMDRIYTVKDSYINVFKEYAVKNGWLYKDKQNMIEREYIVDGKTGEKDSFILNTKSNFEITYYFPYVDTLKYFYYKDGFLTNEKNGNLYGYDYHLLNDTNGGPVNDYNEDDEDDEDDLVYVEYYDDYFSQDYIDNNMVWSEPVGSFLIEYQDAVKSSYYNDFSYIYIPINDSTNFYVSGSAEKDSMYDVIYDDDMDYVLDEHLRQDGFIEYEYDGDTYFFHPDDEDYFIECKSLHYDGNKSVYAHKVWDKDKIFKWKGVDWFNDAGQVKFDELVGQLRMFDSKNNNKI